MLSPGVLLGNRYRLDERIAGGGMGDVWRGTDEVLGRTVAVKILLPALLDEPGFAERFRGEARTMATINHPGVVDVYDYGSDQQIAFLVMEYVEGDALSTTLGRVGRLTPARTMALMAQAADALHAAHEKGIVHRDVKPGNLLVRPNGTLVLTDFGIARSALVGQLTAAGSVLGTASYISPEQATGSTASPASDVYALGVVAYQCLSGRRPFEGENPLDIAMQHVRDTPRPLPADIPPAVRAIVERSMAKDPAARWPTAATLAAVARQAATPAPPMRPPVHPAPPQPTRAAGHPAPPAPAQSGRPAGYPGSVPPGSPVAGPVSGAPPVAPGGTRVGPSYPPPAAAAAASVPNRPGSPAGPTQQPPGYHRGAAAVPAPRPRQEPSYAPPPAAVASRPQPPSPANRSLLVALALVLGLIVLICSGVISYWVTKSNNNAGSQGLRTVTSSSQRVNERDVSQYAPYRRIERYGYGARMTQMSEGRQTR
ncbi:serine/threonine-protein kinase [Micromonospora sp. NBC_01796]|uniref:serine/threonine-protein kinase n=1 Tax=Micromonospora sp. NBC_01796 TaxID=2975987 RepID=UPI002DDC055A|nr:protein kinase [Micromonospora sp. NBC_01796]WSA88644.1 protein kinase [Micromonospora sp. NBC_01796]